MGRVAELLSLGGMTRSAQIVVLVLIGVVGVAAGVWLGYSCLTMQPSGVYIMRESPGDDDVFAVCSFYPSIGSFFRRGGLAVGSLLGGFMTYVSVSSLMQMRKQ